MMFKKTYICPFCFKKNNLNQVLFRCSSPSNICAWETDDIYDRYWRKKVSESMGKVFPAAANGSSSKLFGGFNIPRKGLCPACNRETKRRICPGCHTELPDEIGDYKDMIFSVIGSRESGKSHYIAVLLTKLMNEIVEPFNCNLLPMGDQTIKRYREDFYDPVYKKKETIIATLSKDDKKRIPLIYSLTFTGQSIFGNKKIMDVATVAFFDTAGEDLNSEDIMGTENRYIYNSAGIILLIDPLQFPEVRAQLPGIKLPDENTEVEDIIIRTALLIRKAHDIKRDQLIDIPLAVAFSKIDAIEPLLSQSSGLLHSGEHEGVFNRDDQEDVHGEMESLIREWKGANILTQLKNNFENYAFFGLTALGCNPHGTHEIPKLRPRRVEDPFLWLLWKNGLIPGSDSNSDPDPFA